VAEIDSIALRDENAALKSQVAALTQMVGLTLSLMRKWTAVNEVDLSTLCDIVAQDHPDPHAAEAIALVRVLAIGVHGAAPHVVVPLANARKGRASA
jgi:hypothetical protein